MAVIDREILTVSEVNAVVGRLVEENFPDVAVLGEISNLKRHTSGHVYFTLKDSKAQLSAVCFRSHAENLEVELEDGIQVIASGRLSIYEPYGKFQLVAYRIERAGVGELERAFRELKEKLEKEGLFDAENKKPLPSFPFRIGVITSPTGAAVRDIVSTIKRRWPCAEILLFPVHVQGDQAVPEITSALRRVSDMADVDLVIVGRGGGSLEDLWAFNEESVARAVFDCTIPVISAVGHETDFTITDFVADARAATPTMAGEIAVPRRDEVIAGIEEITGRMTRFIQGLLALHTSRLKELLGSYALGKVRGSVESALQRLDYAREKLQGVMASLLEEKQACLRQKLAVLQSLSPKAVLARGFALCSDSGTGKVIRSADEAFRAGGMRVTFQDGSVRADVKERENGGEEG
jgi:exodeoxyribonuclease VII large subunit